MLRLATVSTWYGERLALVTKGGLVDLTAALAFYLRETRAISLTDAVLQASSIVSTSLVDFLAKGRSALEPTREMVSFLSAWLAKGRELPTGIAFDVKHVQFRAPVPRPPKIWAMRGNYPGHLEEMARRYDRSVQQPYPSGFLKAPTSVIGHQVPIVLPRASRHVEHEVELAVVIARGGSRISESRALQHVGGYTLFVDVSARDVALADNLWVDRSKGFDTFGPAGPYLVPSDELGDNPSLAMELRVNGELRQSANTSDMIFKVPFLVSWVSQFMTLEAGDFICTGTCEGVGAIEHGDVIEAKAEHIGVLRNPVVREK